MIPLLLLALAIAIVHAERDSNSFAYGSNKDNSMYWRDAPNVLQDLSSFSKLYVSFQSCAWSPYTGNGDNDNSCGTETDDAFWYMGATECFRANAAYSLYGVLSGEEDKGCTKRTFINSFFTTSGVESLTQSLYDSGLSFSSGGDDEGYPGGVSSACVYEQGNDDGANNNGDQGISHNQQYGSHATSYGLSCRMGHFVKRSFKGTNCNKKMEIRVTDYLHSFNQDLSKASCIPIYGRSGNNNEGGGDDRNANNALSVLYYSHACSVREFPHECPDPYGMMRAYARADEQAVARGINPLREKLKSAFTWIFLVLGVILLILALLVYRRRLKITRWRRQRDSQWHRRRWFGRQPSNSTLQTEKTAGTEDSSKRSFLKRVCGKK